MTKVREADDVEAEVREAGVWMLGLGRLELWRLGGRGYGAWDYGG